MEPLKNLRLRIEKGVARAYESLTEGWRELLSRSNGALTHFDTSAKSKFAIISPCTDFMSGQFEAVEAQPGP